MRLSALNNGTVLPNRRDTNGCDPRCIVYLVTFLSFCSNLTITSGQSQCFMGLGSYLNPSKDALMRRHPPYRLPVEEQIRVIDSSHSRMRTLLSTRKIPLPISHVHHTPRPKRGNLGETYAYICQRMSIDACTEWKPGCCSVCLHSTCLPARPNITDMSTSNDGRESTVSQQGRKVGFLSPVYCRAWSIGH